MSCKCSAYLTKMDNTTICFERRYGSLKQNLKAKYTVYKYYMEYILRIGFNVQKCEKHFPQNPDVSSQTYMVI